MPHRDRCTAALCTFGIAFIYAFSACGADGLASLRVPHGFKVELAAGPELSSYPMFMEFDGEGRLYVAESTGKDLSGQDMAATPECQILRLEDIDGDGVFDRRTIFAEDLSLPMGVLWHQGALFVASPPDLLRLEDTNEDGVADLREVILTGWNILNTASLHGPFLGPDGLLYLTHGRHGYEIETKEGETLKGLAARIWRCKPDGTQLERFAGGGFDNPIELIFTGASEMIGTMTYFTDPRYGQRDALLHYAWGGVYPKPHAAVSEFIRTGPLMPVMSKFSRIAPSGLLRYRGRAFGADYAESLFSAQFNPHRVQRHRLVRDGATYRTENEDFLTSSSPDFYPTDLIEDADGSLLVCDTGAWYVDACPISRVAKPEVRGAIYRISKIDAPKIDDPGGKQIQWPKLSADQTVAYLADERFRIRKKALQQTLRQGTKAVGALRNALRTSDSTQYRLGALSALSQIADPNIASIIRDALNDPALDVRIAAARILGDLHDRDAVPALIRQLHSREAPERREAATALGRIGDSAALQALIKACAGAEDRFEEHALIYALIEVGETKPLFSALEADKPEGTKVAVLVALDQLGAPGLNANHVIPFLNSNSPKLRETGLWVASHREAWAKDILAYVEARITLDGPAPSERESLMATLIAYGNTQECTDLVARLVGDPEQNTNLRSFLLDTIQAYAQPKIPNEWQQAIGVCLNDTESELRRKALSLIRDRNIEKYDSQIASMADDESESAPFRIAAIAILLRRNPKLEGPRLELILNSLGNEASAGTRREAAALLVNGATNSETKLRLATELLPTADALSMTAILQSMKGESDDALGTAIVVALESNESTDVLLAPALLDTVLETFSPGVQKTARALRELVADREEGLLSRFLALEPRLGAGDVGRGRELFFGNQAACSTCHAIGNEGGQLGPDLTTIGLVRSGHDLLEAILFPNASMVPDYVPYIVETSSEILSGIILEETSSTITLRTSAEETRHIARQAIQSMQPSAVSIMPESLDAGLSDEEIVDLITFLQSLNNEQWLLPAKWDEAK